MKHKRLLPSHVAMICLAALIATTPAALPAPRPATVTVDLRPQFDSSTPLPNPHKGWYHHYLDNGLKKYLVADDSELLDFPGMDHLYLRLAWSYLEPEEGKYNWSVIDPLIEKWTARGFGISFRISCKETGTKPVEQQYATPKWVARAGAKGGHYYRGKKLGPDGPWEPVFDDPVYLAKLDNFLAAFAARYDGKPWLRYIDIGSIGDWGEGHTSSGSKLVYDYAQRKPHVDLHLKHFKKTPIVISDDFVYSIPDKDQRQKMHRYIVDNNITYRDDSILVDWYVQTCYHNATVRTPQYFADTAPIAPNVLELQHYGMAKRIGNWQGLPDSTIAKKGDGRTGPDIFREAVKILRATYIGYHGYAREWLADNPQLTGELLNLCGYWYFLHRAQLPQTWTPGATHTLDLTWQNKGAAPAYNPYQLHLRLEGPRTVDIVLDSKNKNWLPHQEKTYTQSYTVSLPRTIKPGRYRLKLKLHCPQTQRDVQIALYPNLKDKTGHYTITSITIK